jgi:hypothetical protein
MGTRADFYVGRGKDAEWLGSIAMDGYPDGGILAEFCELNGVLTEAKYRRIIAEISEKRSSWTSPEQGWPWPWKDSRTTDYSYAYDDGKCWVSSYGHGPWIEAEIAVDPPKGDDGEYPDLWPDGKMDCFPDMSDRQNVTLGKRSGLIILGG